MPAFDNLDTAFQGLNTWHSFQYLALTFYIIKLRQQIGDMGSSSPVVNRFALNANSLKLYLFSSSMIVGSILLGVAVYITVGIVDPTRLSPALSPTQAGRKGDLISPFCFV